jgi:uncharacterized membrane protein YcaP (DUF421 family)
MVASDEITTEYPVAATVVVALVGVVGYVVPTAIFGNPIEPLPTAIFAVAFAVVYVGISVLQQRFPELQDI